MLSTLTTHPHPPPHPPQVRGWGNALAFLLASYGARNSSFLSRSTKWCLHK